ncbi:MAG: cupin domain-containing protein [Thermomicrobiales bacterium]
MTDSLLGLFNLDDEIARYKPDEANAAGRRAETLIKNERLRVVLVTMRTGISLHEHSAPGPITIHVLQGRFKVTYNGIEEELAVGGLISLDTGVRHEVETLDEGAFLLTIGWAPKSGF